MNSRRPQKRKFSPPKGTIREAIAELKVSHGLVEQAGTGDDIVDIITFCERPDLLNLPANNLNLFVSQRVVLKCLYIGSRGNEGIRLTDEEIQWLKDKKQDKQSDGRFVGLLSNPHFTPIVSMRLHGLLFGRRH